MKKIRTSVFETNSSSSHSLSIHDNPDILDTIVPVNGVIELHGQDFGWGWTKFSDPKTKAIYCAVDNSNHSMLEDVILEHTGAKSVVFYTDDYEIDHQSVGTSRSAFDSEKTLKNFIFSPKSWLFIGDDNGGSPPNFYDVDVVYTHELVTNGSGYSYKFDGYPTIDKIKEAILSLADFYHSSFNGRVQEPNGYYAQEGLIMDSFSDLDKNIFKTYEIKSSKITDIHLVNFKIKELS